MFANPHGLVLVFSDKEEVKRLIAEIDGLCMDAYREPATVKSLRYRLEELIRGGVDNGSNS